MVNNKRYVFMCFILNLLEIKGKFKNGYNNTRTPQVFLRIPKPIEIEILHSLNKFHS